MNFEPHPKMWNLSVCPKPFTANLLKAIQQKKQSWSIKQDGSSKRKVIFPNGDILPKHIRLFFTPLLINVPLEDLDPFYAEMEVSLKGI